MEEQWRAVHLVVWLRSQKHSAHLLLTIVVYLPTASMCIFVFRVIVGPFYPVELHVICCRTHGHEWNGRAVQYVEYLNLDGVQNSNMHLPAIVIYRVTLRPHWTFVWRLLRHAHHFRVTARLVDDACSSTRVQEVSLHACSVHDNDLPSYNDSSNYFMTRPESY